MVLERWCNRKIQTMESRVLVSLSAMIVCVFYIQQCLSFRLQTTEGNETIVTCTTTGGSDRRKRSADIFPPEIDIDFFADGIEVKLQLLRNYGISDKVPLFVYRSEVVKHDVVDSDPVAFYHESKNGSSFMVHRNSSSQTDQLFEFFGTFQIGQHIFLMQPPDGQRNTHTVSRVVEELPTRTDFLEKYDDENRPPRRRRADRKDNSDETAFHREKREIIEYEVEIFIVVDFGVYSFWYDQTTGTEQERADATMNYIRQFYAFVINAINGRYTSVTGNGYTITCLFAGIYIADSKSGAPFIEDRIVGTTADPTRAVADDVLGNFTEWGNNNLNIAYFDHAMLFTAYDIGKFFPNGTFDSAIAGLAWLSQLCKTLKFSINEDHFNVALVTVAAHELGHNVGSQHDGSNNSCDALGGYIMAPSSGTTSDPAFNILIYTFSPCSLVYFDDYIDTLTADNNNCMLTLSSTYDPATNDQYVNDTAGQVYPPDVQCENIIGQGSYLVRRVFEGDYSSICGVMYCAHTANDGSYFYKTAWEGTSCGNGKLCELGNCVSSAKAVTELTETCLFGDIPYTLSSSSQTCEEFLGSSNTSYWCYTDSYRHSCCVTCQVHQQHNINRTDCEYGDKASWCAGLELKLCYSNDGACCQSCPDRALIITNCTYGDKASWCDGMDLVDCYSNADICCQSCPERALSIPDCQYGDKVTGCDADSCNSYSESNKAQCCQTCATTTTTTTTPTTTTPTTTTTTPTTTTTKPSTTTTTQMTTTVTPTTTTTKLPTTTTTPTITTITPTTTTTISTTTTTAPTTTTTPSITTTTLLVTTTTQTTTTPVPDNSAEVVCMAITVVIALLPIAFFGKLC